MVPAGSLKCSKCGCIDGVIVRYPTASVTWAVGGLDKDQEVVYVPISTTGRWDRSMTPSHVRCIWAECSTELPIWLLSLSKYVRPPK